MSRATGWRRQLADQPFGVASLVFGIVFALPTLAGGLELLGGDSMSPYGKDMIRGLAVLVGVAVWFYGRSIKSAEMREAPQDE